MCKVQRHYKRQAGKSARIFDEITVGLGEIIKICINKTSVSGLNHLYSTFDTRYFQ